MLKQHQLNLPYPIFKYCSGYLPNYYEHPKWRSMFVYILNKKSRVFVILVVLF